MNSTKNSYILQQTARFSTGAAPWLNKNMSMAKFAEFEAFVSRFLSEMELPEEREKRVLTKRRVRGQIGNNDN